MKSLFVKQFVDEGLGNSSYLIASEETGIAAVIDPQRDVDKYLQTAQAHGLHISYALETHLHADFVSGSLELAYQAEQRSRYGACHIGASATADVEFRHIALRADETLSLGNLCIKVLATPGHSPEHVSFVIYSEKEKTPGVLFSGGSLIVGGTGRTDLLGHEHAIPLARDLYHTLHHKLAQLPDDVVVYPTHGAGSFCNTTASRARFTTIGEERLANPFFQIHAEEEFVQRALTGLSRYPTYYRYMREINKKGAEILGGLPPLPPISPDRVRQEIDKGAVVIDVRPTPQFLASHIPDSYGIPLSTPLLTWAGWVVPFGSPIILVADTESEKWEAIRQLIRIGYDNLLGYLEGGVEAWTDLNHPIRSTRSLTADQLQDWTSQHDVPYILDVRFNREWDNGHIRSARHIEAGRLPERAGDWLQRDHPVVVYCARGNRSTVAISLLEQQGFKNLYALKDGFNAWEQAGYEIVEDEIV